MRYQISDIYPGRIWRHYKGAVYTTEGTGRQSTNGPDDGRIDVVYRNANGELCFRAASEFLDGRFTPISSGRKGRALQEELIAAGIALCPTCKGYGQMWDHEDEELMDCSSCGGYGTKDPP